MTFYTLKDLNIKLLDFINLLSPLGQVKKIVSNGDRHLVEIYFHDKVNIDNSNLGNEFKDSYINNTLFKLYFDIKMGYIINNNLCILEIPNGIDSNNNYLNNLKCKDKINISKFIKKNIPKDCLKILKHRFVLNSKITDPESVNILNFNGYHKILV